MIEINYIDVDEIPGFSPEFLFEWYGVLLDKYGKTLGNISLILCSDEYLLEMNREHLNHDYYTDIITFDYTEEDEVSGDLFISVDRVKENASNLRLSFGEEFLRVCAHGVLHLCGFKDKSEEDEVIMRAKEDEALGLVKFHVKHLNGWEWSH